MIAMQLAEAARVLEAQQHGADVAFHGLSTDTRNLQRGNLFVALTGPNFDGHDYLDSGLRQGAAAAVVSRPRDTGLPQLEVADTRLALGRLAAHWRERFRIPVVAVTGSNGKTTVKEMLAAILSRSGEVLATRGNLNNDIGLPLTLARLGEEHAWAVLEMGANHPGEIAYLTDLASPDIGLVNNAGPAHLEGFGSLQGVAEAKGELFAGLAGRAVAVINADDPFAPLWRELAAGRRVVDFSLQGEAVVQGDWRPGVEGSELRIETDSAFVQIRLPLLGRHNAMNALAAAACCVAAGVPLEEIRLGLEAVQPVKGRLEMRVLGGRVRLIDDTYNANPASFNVAVEVLAQVPGQRWLVLGDMAELGPAGSELHLEAGRRARAAGIDRLFTLGELATEAARGFGAGAQSFNQRQALCEALLSALGEDTTVLVKGSRFMAMEQVVQALTERHVPVSAATGEGC